MQDFLKLASVSEDIAASEHEEQERVFIHIVCDLQLVTLEKQIAVIQAKQVELPSTVSCSEPIYLWLR